MDNIYYPFRLDNSHDLSMHSWYDDKNTSISMAVLSISLYFLHDQLHLVPLHKNRNSLLKRFHLINLAQHLTHHTPHLAEFLSLEFVAFQFDLEDPDLILRIEAARHLLLV